MNHHPATERLIESFGKSKCIQCGGKLVISRLGKTAYCAACHETYKMPDLSEEGLKKADKQFEEWDQKQLSKEQK